MKKIKLLICVLCCTSAFSQTVQDIGKVILGVQIMENATEETKKVSLQLQNKLIQLAAQAGYSSYGNNQFVISPNVIVNVVDKAEGGMKTIYVVQGDLSLSIYDSVENTVFASISLPFRGSGNSVDKAIMNGVLKISYAAVKETFDEARRKILDYYVSKEEVIFTKADTYVSNNEYDKAIACLMLIPEELLNLHKKALAKATEIYDKRNTAIQKEREVRRRNENDSVLKRAQGYLSMQNPEEALKTLWAYRSGDAKQNAQYDTLVKKSEALITTEKKLALEQAQQEYLDARKREEREWTLYEKTIEHEMSMDNREMDYEFASMEAAAQTEQRKVDAIKTVACEFLKNNPNLLNNLK